MVRTRGGGFTGSSTRRISPTTSGRRACVVSNVEQPPQKINSRLMKRKRSKRQRPGIGTYSTATIKTLPRDSLVEVIATVASHSFIDLHAIKMCCKDFHDAAKDKYVLQRVSLDKFPLVQWLPNDNTTLFLNRCREYGNIESLFREGLRKYFDHLNGNIDDGVEILKIAAQKGHNEAKYVYGMISLCSEDNELRKQGLEYMRYLRKSKCVVGYRNKVKQLLNFMWKNNGALGRNQNPLCNSKNTCKGWRVKIGRWVLLDDDDDDDDNNEDINSCEYCRWDHELEIFYRFLNVR